MYCTKCGNVVSEDWRVCPRCGSPLTPGQAPVPPEGVTGAPVPEGAPRRGKAPSAWLYAVGPAVIVITSVAAIILFVVGIMGMAPDTRFVVPGSQELDLEDTGEYTVYYEYQSTVDGVSYSTGERLPDLVATLRFRDGQRTVPLEDATVDANYSFGSRSGVSMFEFEIDEPGTYVLTAQYQNGRTSPEVVLAVGRFDVGEVVLRSVPLGFVGFVAGLLILVLVLVLRRKAGRTI